MTHFLILSFLFVLDISAMTSLERISSVSYHCLIYQPMVLTKRFRIVWLGLTWIYHFSMDKDVMREHIAGVRYKIQKVYLKALYVHWASYSLNLAVNKALSIANIPNIYGTLQEVCTYFSMSPKRNADVKSAICDYLCETRWVERHDTILRCADLFDLLCILLRTSVTITIRRHEARREIFFLHLKTILLLFPSVRERYSLLDIVPHSSVTVRNAGFGLVCFTCKESKIHY
jgi:hypothetical protein